ncbi:hypothetical protein BO82DRAFT_29636 [Aspergillus uvarum CBS 121591]|uniref:Uncharacterized protein n=1 Tax=Aspergillus uvarum CBS 121591 TaxID=1448315 RepID=A0A319CLK1_9EURO|nr:hypothetical protein BO82DRAFT_29636 [Aspergillus uvarum CBS 121591]PYH83967.1 hypothetical protein BO82DRAFT_29636 [Aspergillus uvarum CBS 121591]
MIQQRQAIVSHSSLGTRRSSCSGVMYSISPNTASASLSHRMPVICTSSLRIADEIPRKNSTYTPRRCRSLGEFFTCND